MITLKFKNLTKKEKTQIEKYRDRMIHHLEKEDNNLYQQFLPIINTRKFSQVKQDASVILAKYYLLYLQSHIRRSLDCKHKNGIWTNKAPIGYLNTRDAEGKPDITVDADRLYKILQLFLRRRDGFTIAELEWLAKQMNLTYSSSKPVVINKRKILQILKNPFYAGDMLIKGELYHHNYPILVGKEIFDAVQKTF